MQTRWVPSFLSVLLSAGSVHAQGTGQMPPVPTQPAPQPTSPGTAPPPQPGYDPNAQPAPAPYQPGANQPSAPPGYDPNTQPGAQPYQPGAQPGAQPGGYPPGYQPGAQGYPSGAGPYPQPGYAGQEAGFAEPPLEEDAETETAWRADEPGVIVSADRLFGFYSINITETESGAETETNSTLVNLLWAIGDPSAPSIVPRLAIDGVVGPGVTLGGSIGYVSFAGETTDAGTTQDNPTQAFFVFNPRVGYIASLSDVISLWPRLGFAYAANSLDFEDSVSGVSIDRTVTLTFLTIDPVLVIHPIPHVGFLIGPVIDISLSGSTDASVSGAPPGSFIAEPDVSEQVYGLTAGLAVFF